MAKIPDFSAKDWKIAIALALLTLAIFLPAVRYDFINLDDPAYVFQNPRVMTGLRGENIAWAFTRTLQNWWLPLLWISFMADASLFGPAPWGFHLTNILLHTASVVLLFLVLRRATGQPWPSAFVAALFAIHPLRLESVVWITERKDVLSGFFWMLGLLAHVRYVEKPSPGWYWLVPLCMLLGLMSKPILVTFPVSLLLLDFWPLRRVRQFSDWKSLLREKLPLFVLSIVFSGITLFTNSIARGDYAGLPWIHRLNLIPRNYMAYLGKLLWPVNLAVIYPEDDRARWFVFLAASLFLLAITVLCLWQRRRPFLLMGWLWFLVTLLPVIRGVRLGLASLADRFTYLPSIGLFILVTWGLLSILPDRPWRRTSLAGAAALILGAAAAATAWNMPFWKNSETLFQRTLSVTSRNYLAAISLANHFLFADRRQEALAYFEKTIELGQGNPQADYLTAVALWRLGRTEEAAALFEQELRMPDRRGEAHNNLGVIAFQQGQVNKALDSFRQAIRCNPRLVDAHFNLGMALIQNGNLAESIPPLRQATQLNPQQDTAHFLLGRALAQQGQNEEALRHFQEALRLQPERVEYREAVNRLRAGSPQVRPP